MYTFKPFKIQYKFTCTSNTPKPFKIQLTVYSSCAPSPARVWPRDFSPLSPRGAFAFAPQNRRGPSARSWAYSAQRPVHHRRRRRCRVT